MFSSPQLSPHQRGTSQHEIGFRGAHQRTCKRSKRTMHSKLIKERRVLWDLLLSTLRSSASVADPPAAFCWESTHRPDTDLHGDNSCGGYSAAV
eukprot:scaffold59395_cov35-Prasinocladus_malaysianus.AAC.1